MNRFLTVAALGALWTTTSVAADLYVPLPEATSGPLSTPFYFTLEGLMLARTGGDAALYHDDDDNEREDSIRDLLGPDLGYGGRFVFGGQGDAGWGFEVGGLYAGGFGGHHVDVDSGNDYDAAYEDDFLGDLEFSHSDNFEGLELTERSSLLGLEASATYDLGDSRLFIGPRWMRYQSQLETVIYDDVNDYLGTDDEIDTVDIASLNDLIGLQVGIDGMIDVTDRVRLGGRAAVGVYANMATLDRFYEGTGGGSPFVADTQESSSSATGFAHSVEVSPRIEFAASENLSLSLGGTLLWLNGVDNPGDHYAGMGDDNGLGTLAADSPGFAGSVLFTGITAGLHGRF